MGRFDLYGDLFDPASQGRMRAFFLNDVAPLGVIRDYARGTSIDHLSMRASMGVVVRGCVAKSLVSCGGREKLLYFLRPGEVFGEMDLLDGGSFPFVLQARERSSVSFVSKRDVEALLDRRPDRYGLFVHSMTRKFRIVSLQLANSVFNGSLGQVAEALLRLASCSDPSGDGPVVLRLTQQELASNIGCSRVAVARALRELIEMGVIERRGREMVLRDLGRLSGLRDGVR